MHGTASGKGVPILTRTTDGDGAGVLLPAGVNHPILPYRHKTRHDSREAKYDKISTKSGVPLTSRCVNYRPQALCNLHTGSYDRGHRATILHSPHQARTRRDRNLATEPPQGISSSSHRISRVVSTLVSFHNQTRSCPFSAFSRCISPKRAILTLRLYLEFN